MSKLYHNLAPSYLNILLKYLRLALEGFKAPVAADQVLHIVGIVIQDWC